MCRCSKLNCKNNGTLAVNDDGDCKCLCRPEFTGESCEGTCQNFFFFYLLKNYSDISSESICVEKEYCSYFNDSYCTVTMIEDNCPKLCGTC